MNENVLNREWSTTSLLRFAFPTIVMMVFMGLYTLVDTIFVSKFVNTNALSAVNIVCPVVNIIVAIGAMLATGGNAIVSRKMGEGKVNEARENFTLLITAGAVLGVVISIVGMVWIDEIVYALGASDLLFPYCKDYLTVLFVFTPANIVQTLFSNLFVTAGRPGMGFGLSVLAGMANIVLDYIFIVPMGMGISGAALGTGIGYLLPSLAGIVFFAKNSGVLAFRRPKLDWRVLKESCFNGSSEMVGQLATAVTTFLFNTTMMRMMGEDGVAAITIIIYSQFLLSTLYIGFSMGVAPVIGFNYGSRDADRQKKVFRICMGFVSAASLLMFAISRFGGPYIVQLFVEKATVVYDIATRGFAIFSFSFLFCGTNIFTSAMFTALSNGKVSAALSFLRTFVLLASGIVVLPRILGVMGIWMAVPMAEGIMLVISLICLICYRREYNY